MDTNNAYNTFSETLSAIMDEIAPVKTIKVSAKHLCRYKWMTSGLNIFQTLNRLLRKKLGKDKSHKSHQEFKKHTNIYNQLKRKTKKKYNRNLLYEHRHNIRKTWGVQNSLIGRINNKTSISETFQIDDKNVTDPKQIGN